MNQAAWNRLEATGFLPLSILVPAVQRWRRDYDTNSEDVVAATVDTKRFVTRQGTDELEIGVYYRPSSTMPSATPPPPPNGPPTVQPWVPPPPPTQPPSTQHPHTMQQQPPPPTQQVQASGLTWSDSQSDPWCTQPSSDPWAWLGGNQTSLSAAHQATQPPVPADKPLEEPEQPAATEQPAVDKLMELPSDKTEEHSADKPEEEGPNSLQEAGAAAAESEVDKTHAEQPEQPSEAAWMEEMAHIVEEEQVRCRQPTEAPEPAAGI